MGATKGVQAMSEKIDRAVLDLLCKRVAKLEASGVRGNGECICQISPEHSQRTMERMLEWPKQRFTKNNDMLFDHRCPAHGEKAQPAVWGRHKELHLSVSWRVWESVGISYEGEAVTDPQHPDDEGVDLFADEMKRTLTRKRIEGRGGWDSPNECSIDRLWELLQRNVSQADSIDVGVYAMMIYNRIRAGK